MTAGAALLLGGGIAGAQSSMMSTTSPAMTSTTPSASDKMFIIKAAKGGNDEIGLSKLALTRASNPNIKAYAKKMIKDHMAIASELKPIAMKLGVTPPATMDAMGMAAKRKLAPLSGAAFDKGYVNAMVTGHAAADKVFKMGTTVKNDALRSFASDNLPTVEDHLKMASEMQQGLKDGTMPKMDMSSNAM